MKVINQDIRVPAVGFATKDPSELAAFYQQALNIPAARKIDSDNYAIEMANFTLTFNKIKDEVKPGSVVVWYQVNNVEEVFTHMVGMGARVRTEVNRDERPGYAIAVLYDPDGNMMGLMGPSVPLKE